MYVLPVPSPGCGLSFFFLYFGEYKFLIFSMIYLPFCVVHSFHFQDVLLTPKRDTFPSLFLSEKFKVCILYLNL